MTKLVIFLRIYGDSALSDYSMWLKVTKTKIKKEDFKNCIWLLEKVKLITTGIDTKENTSIYTWSSCIFLQ